MIDLHIKQILEEGHPVAGVLLSRGGWLGSRGGIEIVEAFPASEDAATVWGIQLFDGEEQPWHCCYTTADCIIAISCKRDWIRDPG